jgi:hypothetical protein
MVFPLQAFFVAPDPGRGNPGLTVARTCSQAEPQPNSQLRDNSRKLL